MRREYVAAGEAASLFAKQDKHDRAAVAVATQTRAVLVCHADEILNAGADFDRLADGLFRAVMSLAGYALHKRSEWRRIRGVQPMATVRDLGTTPRNPTANHAAPAKLDAPTRAALEAAGPGGAAALAVACEVLRNPKQAEALGYAALTARITLVNMLGLKDTQIAATLARQCETQMAQLLADSGPEPSLAEWMAAARVVNNWLTVHAIEATAASNVIAGGSAGALERRLTQAERRLHASLKSLAVLRRLRQPATMTQVNIAKRGPLVVNNGTPENPS